MKNNIQTKRNLYKFKFLRRIGILAAVAVLGIPALITPLQADSDARTPEVPSPLCDDINAPVGHRLKFRAYAIGVQIYEWTGSGWLFKGPEADLYADAGLNGKIGTHSVGPTWEANDGSVVLGASPVRCPLSPNDIPWLLLTANSLEYPGLFSNITYIQRVNTEGGIAPSNSGSFVGEIARVPYTAEYYFYRAE
jgi:hypothetical protein